MSPVTRLLHGGVRLYQRATAGRPSPCRYVPTCSNYALDAFEHHGAVRQRPRDPPAVQMPPLGWSRGGSVPEGKHH